MNERPNETSHKTNDDAEWAGNENAKKGTLVGSGLPNDGTDDPCGESERTDDDRSGKGIEEESHMRNGGL